MNTRFVTQMGCICLKVPNFPSLPQFFFFFFFLYIFHCFCIDIFYFFISPAFYLFSFFLYPFLVFSISSHVRVRYLNACYKKVRRKDFDTRRFHTFFNFFQFPQRRYYNAEISKCTPKREFCTI